MVDDSTHRREAARLVIVMPVFNDWESFTCLVRDIEVELAGIGCRLEVLAVDDCSTETGPVEIALTGVISRVRIARLGINVGHQRAIAVGLVHVSAADESDLIAVMDSDGEDRPDELRRLIEMARRNPDRSIVAQRRKRSETALFRFFYMVYKLVFALFTGKKISFGNFSLLPARHISQVVHNANIWNNFAASLIQSRVPIVYVPTIRGQRYAGHSKMNFVSLVTHGLGAISVFSEAVFIRILLMSCAMFGLSVAAIVGVLAIRLFSDLAVPGWTTNVLGFAFLISVQAVMMPVMIAFLLLNSRASIQNLPKDHASSLIESIRTLWSAPVAATVRP